MISLVNVCSHLLSFTFKIKIKSHWLNFNLKSSSSSVNFEFELTERKIITFFCHDQLRKKEEEEAINVSRKSRLTKKVEQKF